MNDLFNNPDKEWHDMFNGMKRITRADIIQMLDIMVQHKEELKNKVSHKQMADIILKYWED